MNAREFSLDTALPLQQRNAGVQDPARTLPFSDQKSVIKGIGIKE